MSANKKMKIGIQLYSLRNAMAEDPLGTLGKVMDMGYRYLEVANHKADTNPGIGYDVPMDKLKDLLTQKNASIVSAHVFPLIPEKLGPSLEFFSKLGTKYICWSMDFFTSYDDTKQKAETMNKIGSLCKEYGQKLLYHNHFHEFQKIEGKEILDILIENTDPELVGLELDTYWAMRAGKDPVAVLKKYGKRIPLIHQKDYPKGLDSDIDLLAKIKEGEKITHETFASMVDQKSFTEVGTGIMDIQSIVDAANEYCDYIILEQDFTQMPTELDSVKKSMDNFKNFRGVEL